MTTRKQKLKATDHIAAGDECEVRWRTDRNPFNAKKQPTARMMFNALRSDQRTRHGCSLDACRAAIKDALVENYDSDDNFVETAVAVVAYFVENSVFDVRAARSHAESTSTEIKG